MDYNILFSRVLHFIMLPMVALSFVIISLTNDLRIYLGVANIATHYYPFPQSIDLAWEIKPVMNRLINYILFNIANNFVPLDNIFWFGVAIKTLGLIIVVIVAWYFAKQINIPYTFAVTFLTLTTMANFFIMQAEYWALVFSILCISLMLTKSPYKIYVAGCLIPIITLFKGISGLMLIPILCSVFLFEDKQFVSIKEYLWDYRYFIGGMLFSGFIFIVLQLTIWPHIYSDAVMSAYLANAGRLLPLNAFIRAVTCFIILPLYFPVMGLGVVFGFYFIARLKYLNDRYVSFAYVLMWITPIVILIPQGEYFMYQFTGLAIPALTTFILSERCLQ